MLHITNSAGGNCNFFEIGDDDIQDVFGRIAVELTQRTAVVVAETEDHIAAVAIQQREVNVKLNFFAVYLDLDISRSMQGQRWRSVVQGVSNYMET
eukprot:TRINITY_DN15793_c0_g1_i1.p1 TRINITY_DN15793_c0_g1~~TRINITY_DN15793_c0_g1_i1.p1  ORF type:complete len:103 (+),score=18.90 TRINITY_DN15793_c0_g1_i1:24-311(+)